MSSSRIDCEKFYINGRWVLPRQDDRWHELVDPATEEPMGRVALGSPADVDAAVASAAAAFSTFSCTTRGERVALLNRIAEVYKRRYDDVARAISREIGAPIKLAKTAQTGAGYGHIKAAAKALEALPEVEEVGGAMVVREAVGVCGLITPWNWPMNQVACKVAPALAAGCTVVLKPSEFAPYSANIFAEILHEAGVPPGVFNLVHGDGPGVGHAIAAHRHIDMVSFTGSTRAGILVAKAAADTVKRVSQELGGKSPNIILPDLDAEAFAKAVAAGVSACYGNSGQSCNAPTRMLVPAARIGEANYAAKKAAEKMAARTGPPTSEATALGPLVNAAQWKKVQALIEEGEREGARLLVGGTGRPNGGTRGYFVKPTVFTSVDNSMRIAREEVFGPVLCIMPYRDVDDAVAIANDTVYGLAAYISGGDDAEIASVARRLRAGSISVNGARQGASVPFGGYKQSGNGREWGSYGLHEYLEIKAVVGLKSSL